MGFGSAPSNTPPAAGAFGSARTANPPSAGQFGAVSAAWTPAQLFASAAGCWLDPSDLSTVWQDSGGTTPGAVNSPVGLIQDKSGSGNHASQSTADARPTLRQDGNGNYYLEFDGTDDSLSIPGLGTLHYNGGSGETFTHAMATLANDTGGLLYSQTTNGTEFYFIYTSGSSNTGIGSSAAYSAVRKNGSSYTYSTRGEGYTMLATLGVVTCQLDTTGWDNSPAANSFGISQYGGLIAEVDTYSMIWVVGAVTGDDLDNLESWVAGKCGVSW